MKDLVKRPVAIAAASVMIVALLAWWFAWMTPQQHKLNGIRQQEAANEQRVSSLMAELAVLRADSKVVRRSSPFLSRFNQAIPGTPDAPGLVVQVYRLATSTGVKLQSITDDTVIPSTGYSTIPVSIAVAGGHDAVLSFVSGMYNLPRLLTIQNIAIAGSGNINTPGSEAYNASITATAYTTALTSTASS